MFVHFTILACNEENQLIPCIHGLYIYIKGEYRFSFEKAIVDDGFNNRSLINANEACSIFSRGARYIITRQGRCLLLEVFWCNSDAGILSYMNVDLSTQLDAFPSLIETIITNCYSLAIGSRLLKARYITRCLK